MSEPVSIEKSFQIPVSHVWKVITDASEMRKWFFEIPGFRAEPDYEFRFQGGPEERQYTHICRVIEVIKERKMTWSWKYEGFEGDSMVTFKLENVNGYTKLTILHEGLASFPMHNPDFNWVNFQAGWNQIMMSLSGCLEKKSVISMGQ